MHGNVLITCFDENDKIVYHIEESNMICIGAGKTIADVMTMPPSLSAYSNTSSILDTSNYVIQGISFAKSKDGYTNYAHAQLTSALEFTAVVVKSVNSTSSINTSSVTGIRVPSSPNPLDTRVERLSTSSLWDTSDIGHNLNAIEFSGLNGLGLTALAVGCYPPSSPGGFPLYVTDVTGGFIGSALFESQFNKNHVMDQSGMVHLTTSSVKDGADLAEFPTNQGLWPTSHQAGTSGVSTGPAFSGHGGQIGYNVILSAGDFAFPAAFGGIYAIGLWTLDVPQMLKNGLTPPYSFGTLNNIRIYRLFAKKVFLRDLTHCKDVTTDGEPANLLNYFSTPVKSLLGISEYKSKIQWRISF